MKDFLDRNKISYFLNEPLKNHTSFKIGGETEYFILPKNESELCAVIRKLNADGRPYAVIGKGSNLLVPDEGTPKVVVRLSGEFEKIELIDETTVKAYAGVNLVSLCKFALEHSLTGLEFAYGIPGSVGGGVYMNAGAYGGQMSDVVSEVIHMTENGEIASFSEGELAFDYRKSVYTNGSNIILSAVFSLEKGNKEEIREKMADFLNRRKSKQPLEYPSAGSVFKRPEGYFAGALIEQCGLKGRAVGGCQVSEKHAGFIVNKGGATCRDVLELIKICQDTVKEKFEVSLETEIKMI